MREIIGRQSGDLVVEHEGLRIHGTVSGDLRLRTGAEVEMEGDVGGSVDVEAGDLRLYGTVGGDMRNRGGVVHIYGRVLGRVLGTGGVTVVTPDSDAKP